MSYKLIWEQWGVIKHFHGRVTSHELLTTCIDIESDPRFDHMRYVINDFTECTAISADIQDIEEISAIDSAAALTNPNIRIAVVTESPEIIALAQHYAETQKTVYQTRLFPTQAEARRWLFE